MKIAEIELFQVDLPYSGGVYVLSGGREYTSFDASIVRISTECGIEGWGESTPFGSTYVAAHALGTRAGIAEIAPHLLGRDPRQVDRINDAMDLALVGHNHAKTALDVACWDVFGKSVKVGALESEGGPALDAERITASLADRQPGEYYIVDANGGLIPETALRMLRLLPDGLDFVLEAPCATWRETLSLRKRCTVPIIIDELAQQDNDITAGEDPPSICWALCASLKAGRCR